MNWNMMEYLPEAAACQMNFSAVVAGYISAIYQHLHQESTRITPGNTPMKRRLGSQQTPQLGVGAHASTAEYAKELISGEMAQKLFL